MKNHDGSMTGATCISRRDELLQMGLLTTSRRIQSGEDIKLTEKGMEIAAIAEQFAKKVTKTYSKT